MGAIPFHPLHGFIMSFIYVEKGPLAGREIGTYPHQINENYKLADWASAEYQFPTTITHIEFAEAAWVHGEAEEPLLWQESNEADLGGILEGLKSHLLFIPNDTDPSAFCIPWICKLEKKELMKLEAILTELRKGKFSWENDDFLLGLLVIVGSFCETYPVSLSKFSGPDCIYVEPGTLVWPNLSEEGV
jgi:hypothetical protein